ncbi:hypothetical protein HMPREF2955_02835 [Prevotella sp. HMSC073D09]|uniref:hypothetical protein n=1 Tax=Prevotella sp. HMSC073D09 TaxID=1739459 RepID=UPI0008A139DD|nr:hypothetical protein [Prevotella sp. HMSC073D09]OFQ09175.1 hypothetical protein HMPREF2955_02835 [Prevotella sp. HMSC073D09]
MAKKGKMAAKKWGLVVKKWVIGLGKLRAGIQIRKAKWCKMQVLFSQIDKISGVEGYKKWKFVYFIA